MENTDSYPVFHTRLARTLRRRLAHRYGTHTCWLTINAADQLTEVDVSAPSIARPSARSRARPDDPPRLSIPSPR